jgi:anion transporter
MYSKKDVISLIVALLAFVAIINIPFAGDLSPQGKVMIAVTAAMFIIWVAEPVTPAVSTFFIFGLIGLGIPLTKEPNGTFLTTAKALDMALSGFTSSAWLLVFCALFIAAAIETTGLGERIGLLILSLTGGKTKSLLGGVVVASIALNSFIPAAVGTCAILTAIMNSVLKDYKLNMRSNTVKACFLTISFGTLIGPLLFLTGGAPSVQAAKYILDATQHQITYGKFFIYGLPMAVLMGTALFVLVSKLFPPEQEELLGGAEVIRAKLASLGPLKGDQKRLMAVLATTVALWATGGLLHKLDLGMVALLAVIVIFLPFMKIGTWKKLSASINWGTIVFFGAAISLGTSLLRTGAASFARIRTSA